MGWQDIDEEEGRRLMAEQAAPVIGEHGKSPTVRTGANGRPIVTVDRRDPILRPQSRQVGPVEAGARGYLQGVTGGWSEELTAAAKHPIAAAHRLIGGENDPRALPYLAERDEQRLANREASDQNPVTSTVSEMGGNALASMALPSARGGTVAQLAKAGAIQGGVAGGGYSEAPTLNGTLANSFIGAGTGAALAAGTAAIGRGAPSRLVKRTLGDFTDGATQTSKTSLLGRAGQAKDEVAAHILDRQDLFKGATKHPGKVFARVEAERKALGQKLGGLYVTGDQLGKTVPMSDLAKALYDIRKSRAGSETMSTAVDGIMESLQKRFGGKRIDRLGVSQIPLSELHTFSSELGERAYANIANDPSASKRLQQRLSGAITDVLKKHMEGVPGAKDLPALNKEYGFLKSAEGVLATRAKRTHEGLLATLNHHKEQVLAGLGMAGGLASGNMELAGGLALAGKAALPVARAADTAYARLINAAASGSTRAQLGQMAIEMGLTQTAADAVARLVATQGQSKPIPSPSPAGAR